MHDKLANKIENKTEEREEDTEKFYVAEEGVPLYICDQNALIAYYGSEIELNRTIVSPRGDGIYSARLPLRSEERRVGKECRSRWSPYH